MYPSYCDKLNPRATLAVKARKAGRSLKISEFSWYDYDEKVLSRTFGLTRTQAAREVSITEIVFSIRRA